MNPVNREWIERLIADFVGACIILAGVLALLALAAIFG
jgi:hypothetical protein